MTSLIMQPGVQYGLDFGMKLDSGSTMFIAYNVTFQAHPEIEIVNWTNYLGGTRYPIGYGQWAVFMNTGKAIGSSSYTTLGKLYVRHNGSTNAPRTLDWTRNGFTDISTTAGGVRATGGTAMTLTTGPGWTPPGTNVSVASPEGDSGSVGGIDFTFDNVTTGGEISAEHQVRSDPGLYPEALAAFDFALSSNPAEMWDIEFAGDFTGSVTLTFHYDDAWLSVPEEELVMLHKNDDGFWEALPTIAHDLDANLLTVETDSFSPFVLGTVVPEPATMSLLAMGALALLRRKRK